MEESAKSIQDIMQILRKRRWSLILPMAAVFLAAVAAALLWPPTYRATSTILIEEQEIPREFVAATVTSYAEQRLQNLNQRIMSSTRLLEIVSRFNLYADKREKWTTEEIVEKMRKDIKFQTISADVIDRRTGRPTAATIAFSVSYEGGAADTVLQVANVLASLFLEENMKVREQQTAGASKFLEEEGAVVQQAMAALEAKIANYRGKNINSLPEMLQANLQTQDRLERDITQLNDQLRGLKEKEGYLTTQLASIPPELDNRDPGFVDPEWNRLNGLRAKLLDLTSRYSDAYPDVIKTKAEIAEMEKRVKPPVAAPDKSPNPAYITLSAQLAGIQSDIDSVKRQIGDLNKQVKDMRYRTAATPKVEEDLKALLIDRNNTQLKYDDLMKKLMESRVAQGLEKGQLGERFSLVDPARLPEKPISPNRLAIILIGLLLGIGSGVGTASLREFADQSARNPEELERATGLPVLATIPRIVTCGESRKQLHRKILIYVGIVLAICAGLALLHFYVMDLDVLWARLMRKLEM
jgi:succinoglycan biosynthesis transport protein ExoP